MKKTILTIALAVASLVSNGQTSQVVTNIKIVKFAYPMSLMQSVTNGELRTYLTFDNAEYNYIKDSAELTIDDVPSFIKSLEVAVQMATMNGVIHSDGNISTSDRNSRVIIHSEHRYTILEVFQANKLIKKLRKLNK